MARNKGESKREYAARKAGGVLDYKTGKVVKQTPKLSVSKFVPPKDAQVIDESTYLAIPKALRPTNVIVAKKTPEQQAQTAQKAKDLSTATNDYIKRITAPIHDVAREERKQRELDKMDFGLRGVVRKLANTGPSTKEVVSAAPSFIRSLIAGTARLPVTIPTKTMLTFTGQKEYVPETKFEKFISGNEPVKSYSEDAGSIAKWAEGKGLSRRDAALIGVTGGIGQVGLDFFFGGKGKAAEQIVKATTERSARAVIEKAGVKATPELISRIINATDTKTAGIIAKELARPGKDTFASKNIIDAFNSSTGQKEIATIGDVRFEIGSLGMNQGARKTGQSDRFSVDEIGKTIGNIKRSFKASNDPKNYRSENIAWVAEMPNGEKRVVYTRKNANGAEEVINWHKLDETKNPNYLKQLESFGSPDGNRTHILRLEGEQSNPLAYGAEPSIAPKPPKVNQVDFTRQLELTNKRLLENNRILTEKLRNKKLASELKAGGIDMGKVTQGSQPGKIRLPGAFNRVELSSPGKLIGPARQGKQVSPGEFSLGSFSPQQPRLGSQKIGGIQNLPKLPNQKVARQTWIRELGTSIQETLQDNWIRVKKLVEDPNVKINPGELTPYEAETLFHGRVGHRLEQANDAVRSVDKEIAAAEASLKNQNLRKDIDKYLVAKHAPERNAIHGEGAAGMTNDEASAIVEELGKNKEVVTLSKKVKELNDQTLDILHDSQVIDDDMYRTLRETYKEHVPLNRVLDENEDMGQILVGRGFDVRSSGIKRANGSKLEVADVMTNITANLEQAIVRAEKNRVNLSTLKFARENKNLGIFTEIKPKAIGQTFDGKPILQQVDDPLVLTVRENGKPVYLRINDERMAIVFKGIGNEKLPPMLSFVNVFTRLYSGLATRFNPEFVLSNKLRDLQEMVVFMGSQKGIGFFGAGKAVARDTASMKDVVSHMRGKDTPGARLYKQMMEDGGTTGGQALSTRKQVELDIDAIRKLNRGGVLNMRQQGKKIIDAFDSWNQIFEDSTRLSVYKTALDKGISRDKAAILAKNSTINFNKKGTGGPVINALYMFSNASIQGSTKLIRAMKNPKVASAVTLAVGSSVWAANSWNDQVDPEWRDKVSEFDRNSNLVVVYPSETGSKYFTIPVSWGIKPMKVMADYAYDASNGKATEKSGLAIAGKVLSSIWDAYNPVGGSDLVSSAVPSFLDIPVEIARNQKWSGSKLRPDSKEGVPESENYFKNKEGVPSDKSKIFNVIKRGVSGIAAATGGNVQFNPANLKYALDGYLSGLGRSVTGVFETVSSVSKGSIPQASDIPFVRRFYKEKTPEELETTQKYAKKDRLYDDLKKTAPEEQPKKIQEYINALPDEQRKGAAYGLMMEGFNTKGVSTSETIIRMKPTYDKVQELVKSGNMEEAKQITQAMSKDEYEDYKKVRAVERGKRSAKTRELLDIDPVKAVEYVHSLDFAEQKRIVENLTKEEYAVYKTGKR